MSHHIGDTYFYIDSMKNGLPHYVETKIQHIRHPDGDVPGTLFLENGAEVELIRAVTKVTK
jgi:hypothetical protein